MILLKHSYTKKKKTFNIQTTIQHVKNLGGVKDETTDDDTCEANSEDEPDYVDTTNLEYKSESAPYKRQKRKKRKNVQFTCEQCDNIYNSSKKLVEHCIKDHGMRKLDIKPFSCER